MKKLLLLAITIFALAGCKKEEDVPGPAPALEFVSVTPTSATEFSDSLVFTIHYTDVDGDLGENNPDVKNLFLTDNRIGIQYAYRVQQLAPSGADITISGNLQVVLNTIARTDTSVAQETATFTIYMKDRAGHVSNSVVSPVITIHP